MRTNRNVILFMLISSLFLVLSACGGNAKKYSEDLEEAKMKLLLISAKAEEMLNNYSYLWGAKIEKKDISAKGLANDLDTSLVVIEEHFNVGDRGSSILEDKVLGDYNSVINGLQSFYRDKDFFDELEELLSEAKSEVQSLNNPPKDYEQAFDRLLEMYSLTEEMASLAISPSGSFLSFNEKRGQLSNDIVKLNKEIEVLLPE